MPESLTLEWFSCLLSGRIFGASLKGTNKIGVAVSGGPDSMALLKLLSDWAAKMPAEPEVHAITVDHKLRPEAAKEAAGVAEQVKNWPCVVHKILCWEGEKPVAALMEEARKARYELIADYCAAKNIDVLFLAHHRNDQAETFLFRLAKGSGLDGLAGMKPVQPYSDSRSLLLLRPLLSVSKQDLIDFCAQSGVVYALDPSNKSLKYLRPRLRKAQGVLEKEGLSSKRLSVTTERLARAREALDYYTFQCYEKAAQKEASDLSVLKMDVLKTVPEEIALRCILRVIEEKNKKQEFPVRLYKLETLVHDLLSKASFRKRTLAGLVFERKDKENLLYVSREK